MSLSKQVSLLGLSTHGDSHMNKQQMEEIESIYTIRAQYANGCYVSRIVQDGAIMFRLTFVEQSVDLQKNYPVAAVVLSLTDLKAVYGVVETTLEPFKPKEEVIPEIKEPPKENEVVH